VIWNALGLWRAMHMALQYENEVVPGAVQARNWGKFCKKRIVLKGGELEAAIAGRPYASAFAAMYPRKTSVRGIALLPLVEIAEVLKVLFESGGVAPWPPPCPAGTTGGDPFDPEGWMAWLNHSIGEHVLEDSALWKQPAWLPAAVPATPGGGGDGQTAPA